jgi:hypothetical protein
MVVKKSGDAADRKVYHHAIYIRYITRQSCRQLSNTSSLLCSQCYNTHQLLVMETASGVAVFASQQLETKALIYAV